jgi:Glycosyl transferase family 2
MVGGPRTAVVLGEGDVATVARERAGRLVDEKGSEAVELVVVDSFRNGHLATDLARFVPRLADGGRLLVAGSRWARRGANAELHGIAELEPLAPDPAAGILVFRRRPVRRKLSLTVGMISMNEAGAVGRVVDEILAQAPGAEVLLVDSSKDETPDIARAKGARVVRQFPPRGYGPAMWRLLTEATTDVIVTMDCDGTYPADKILELHRRIEEGADLVNATRTRSRPKAMPLANYIANRVFAGTARVLHGLPTTDIHSGMRAYRTSMLRALDLVTAAKALPVDLLVVPARLGYHVVEVEIPYFERVGETTLNRYDDTVWTFKRLLGARAGHRSGRERYRNE